MRVTSGKSRVRESRMSGSVRAKPNGRATRPRPRRNLSLTSSNGCSRVVVLRPARSSPRGGCLNDGALEMERAAIPAQFGMATLEIQNGLAARPMQTLAEKRPNATCRQDVIAHG